MSSADPTCLRILLVIVPLFKITFLAFSIAESHHILFCDCIYYVKANHSDVLAQHYYQDKNKWNSENALEIQRITLVFK